MTREMLSIPKLPFLAIGFLEALGVVTGMSAAGTAAFSLRMNILTCFLLYFGLGHVLL